MTTIPERHMTTQEYATATSSSASALRDLRGWTGLRLGFSRSKEVKCKRING